MSAYTGVTSLVTGANGFVASYLLPRLRALGARAVGLGRQPTGRLADIEYHQCDLLDPEAVRRVLAQVRPAFVFHLASQASVGSSWEREWETIETNVRTTFNLFRGAELEALPTRVLLVSSGEVYGDRDQPAEPALDLRPLSPYALSKAMMENLAHSYRKSTVSYVIARAFNHTGPGRPTRYFESSIARQLADAVRRGETHVDLTVGKVDNIRDYSDVRDVVDKYLELAHAPSGTVANVCSGKGVELRRVIELLAEIAGVTVTLQVDPTRLRKNDIQSLVGVDASAGPARPLVETLSDLYHYERDR